MKNLSRSQTIIVTTILFYLVVLIFPGTTFTLPMVVNVITELTDIFDDPSKETLMNGVLPLIALMILMVATSYRIRQKGILYFIAIGMLIPSVLLAYRMNLQINGWSIMTFSVIPFCIVTFVGVMYFTARWVRSYMRDN